MTDICPQLSGVDLDGNLVKIPCQKHDCPWYIQIQGKNPNTGADISEWGCAIAWMPFLTIENSKMQRETGAAVESFRNEMVKANHDTAKALGIGTKQIK